MKKKLALLLAAVMTVTALPVNTFASSENKLTRSPVSLPKKTLLVETNATPPATGALTSSGFRPGGLKTDELEWMADGTNLNMKINDTVATGSTIRLTLSNAYWFFRENGVATKHYSSTVAASYAFGGLGSGTGRTYDNNFGRLVANPQGIDKVSTIYERTKMGSPNNPVIGDGTDALYTLVVSESNPAEATITFNKAIEYTAGTDKYVVIPLVCRTLGEGDAKVTINQMTSTLTGNTLAFMTSSTAATKAYVYDPEEARTEFPIDKFVIDELRVNSIEEYGSFEIAAPSGFTWKRSSLKSGEGKVLGEKGLLGPTWFDIYYKEVDGDLDTSTLVVEYRGLTRDGSSSTGTLYLTGLVLAADDDAPFGDIKLKLRSVDNDCVSNQNDILGGKRVDWTITFTTKGDIPTLVTGRYIAKNAAAADDDYHLAATVVFKENSVSAWWAERRTEFQLPKGVKVRKMEITTADNMYIKDSIDMETELLEPKIYSTTASTFVGTAASGSSLYTIDGLGVYYWPNDGKKHGKDGSVKIDDNVITLESYKIVEKEKAELEFKLWVSIAANYTGDVTLKATGSAVPEDLAPIVIAHTKQPIKVEAEVKDIVIGLQYQAVGNFTITETEAGMLEKNKQVRVSVSDVISSDMSFTPGSEITPENIKIKDVEINSRAGSATTQLGEIGANSAYISFKIDQESSNSKPGVIKFKNLQVKIDRTVPESSLGYDLVVWGTAVAENFGTFKDQFQEPGVKAPYLKVVTSANSKGSISSKVVKVTIGDPVVIVGADKFTMDTAAYISPTSESTMVPIRFVSQALGVAEEKVMWDPLKSTVTVDASQSNATRIIQMTTGSDQITINGISTTMYSPNMTPVKMEIKDERSFIPFRAMGNALGVSVTWDAETRTAIYNFENDIKNPNVTTPAATTAPVETPKAVTE